MLGMPLPVVAFMECKARKFVTHAHKRAGFYFVTGIVQEYPAVLCRQLNFFYRS